MHEHEEARRHGFAVKQSFSTSVGTVEVLLDEQSRIVSAYRFNAEGRPVAAALESWDHTDLAELLAHQAGVPPTEANDIASVLTEELTARGEEPPRAAQPPEVSADKPSGVTAYTWILAIAALALLAVLAVSLWTTLQAIL